MHKLKEAYDIKKQLINNDINELGSILKENYNIETININPDNTRYLESNCGMDSINNDLESGIVKWIKQSIALPDLICNVLPLSNNSCIVKI